MRCYVLRIEHHLSHLFFVDDAEITEHSVNLLLGVVHIVSSLPQVSFVSWRLRNILLNHHNYVSNKQMPLDACISSRQLTLKPLSTQTTP